MLAAATWKGSHPKPMHFPIRVWRSPSQRRGGASGIFEELVLVSVPMLCNDDDVVEYGQRTASFEMELWAVAGGLAIAEDRRRLRAARGRRSARGGMMWTCVDR